MTDKKNTPTNKGQSSKTQSHYISIADALNAFRDAMARSMGTAPDEVLPDQFTRWDDPQGKRGNKACSCIFYTDGRPAGYFCNWRTGHSETWVYGGYSSLTPLERTRFEQQMKEAKAKREAEEAAKHERAAKKAWAIWEQARLAPENHPYLIKKMVSAGVWSRFYDGDLILPVLGFDDRLHSLQKISPDGLKRFEYGGKKAGCYIPVWFPQNAEHTFICEGWATGKTLADSMFWERQMLFGEDAPGFRMLAAMDAGNLEKVAKAAREKWPESRLIICGDDDRASDDNKGRKAARQAARSAGATVCFPAFPPDAPLELSDFNDLMVWQNRGAK